MGVDDSVTILSNIETGICPEYGEFISLRFCLHGDLLDFYAGGKLVCSLLDDTEDRIHFGTVRIVTNKESLRIRDISIDTDYYFWSRRENRFIYRGQEAVPVGFNTFPRKYPRGRDLYDCLTAPGGVSPESESLTDMKLRMDLASASGARVLRVMLVSGYVYDSSGERTADADVPFAFFNTVHFGEYFPDDEDPTGTIDPEAYSEYLDHIVEMARERDIFVLFTLRNAASGIWEIMDETTHPPWNEPAGLLDYNYVGEIQGEVNIPKPHNLVDRIYQITGPLTDEPAIVAWQYFNEAKAKYWIFRFKGDEPDHAGFDRVADFFISCTQILVDEDIDDDITTGSMVDKHLFASGIWPGGYMGWDDNVDSTKSKILILDSRSYHLFNHPSYCRYDDFIDHHSYGDNSYHGENNQYIDDTLYKYTKNDENRYKNNICPPMIYGEINPLGDVILIDGSSVVNYCVFAGYDRTFSGNDNRDWTWTIDSNNYNSVVWDTEIDTVAVQVQSFDDRPCYIRQNYHYKLWKEWYGRTGFESDPVLKGVTNVLHYRNGQENRKMGFFLWHLVNSENEEAFKIDEGEVFDLALRDGENEITGYEYSPVDSDWHKILLNDPYVYPFYTNLCIWDWAQR